MTFKLRNRRVPGVVSAVVLLSSVSCTARAQEGRLPIIDMHVHAYRADFLGPHPVNPVTGVPAVASTDRELQIASIAAMKQLHIVHAVAGGPPGIVAQWKRAEPDMIIGSVVFPFPGGWPRVDSLRAFYQSGALQAMGELTLQYEGASLSSKEVEPYLALAEELNIPVGVHMGLGPAGISYRAPCCPRFRAALGNPLIIEDALVRHPKLRVYMMHAGFPYVEETIALMHAHPQLRVDLAGIDWLLPREEFHEFLRRLLKHDDACKLAKRVMFGTDQVVWPEAFAMAVDNIESADFVSAEQKRDIFCRNAAQFLGLKQRVCERR